MTEQSKLDHDNTSGASLPYFWEARYYSWPRLYIAFRILELLYAGLIGYLLRDIVAEVHRLMR